jgi:hypothetical protein
MKIYLLRLDDERCIFYSEEPETTYVVEDRVQQRGLRDFVERKYHKVQAMLKESESGVGLRVRRIWEWLQERTSPDEAALRRLRQTPEITVFYPLSLTKEAARELWINYLSNRQRRHLLWLVINALVVPVTLLLTPLPGPNLIGYWFIYRAVCHTLACIGVRRAKNEEHLTQFRASSALDSFDGADEEETARLAETLELKHLVPFVHRIARERHAPLAVS